VVQSTKFEFITNLLTARSLGLQVSPSPFARAKVIKQEVAR
jgi:hypothetical protein